MEITVFKNIHSCMSLPKSELLIMSKRIAISFLVEINIRFNINVNYSVKSLI